MGHLENPWHPPPHPTVRGDDVVHALYLKQGRHHYHLFMWWKVIAMILNHRQYLDILFFTTIIITTTTILIIRSTFDELKMQSGSRVSGSRPSTSCSPQGPLNIMLEIVIIIVIRTGATSKRCQKEMIGVECRYWSSDHQCKLFFRDWRWVSPRWR